MLSIRVRAPKGTAVVQIDPTISFGEFKHQALLSASLNINDSFLFRVGFPPKDIQANDDEIVSNIIKNQETVVIEPQGISTHVPRKSKASKFTGIGVKLGATATEDTSPSITQQVASTVVPVKAKIEIKVAPNRKRFKGVGVKLNADTSSPLPPASNNPPIEQVTEPARRRKTNLHLGSKDDVGVKLVQAVSGGGQSTTDIFFRKATKNAVNYQYDMTLANARLSAALSNKFSIQLLDHGKMKVRFLHGPRTWKEEVVDCLQPAELQTAIKCVLLDNGDKEMLKPFNMAQCSPRVFWSLARLYNGQVDTGLESILPDEDWSFIDTRFRTLSAKAQESLATGGGRWRNEEQIETPLEEPTRVEVQNDDIKMPAREQDPVEMRSLIRKAAARAAMNRMHPATLSESKIPHPNDEPATQHALSLAKTNSITVYCDACSKARVVDHEHEEILELDQEEWTCDKLVKIGRDGGCTLPDDEMTSIVGSHANAFETIEINHRKTLASADSEEIFSKWRSTYPHRPISEDIMEEFIQQAQGEELDETMREIVQDNHEKAIEILENAKLSTPYDLASTPSDLIMREFPSSLGYQLSDIEKWKELAKNAMEMNPWMERWRSV